MNIYRSVARTQLGAATLLVSVILLFAATLVVMVVARTSITEQQLSANEVRSKAAFAAANAGLDHAIAHFQTGQPFPVPDIANPTGALADTLDGGSRYLAWFCEPNTPVTESCSSATPCALVATSGERRPAVVACGWSDDQAARHIVMQTVATTPSTANAPSNPLITQGSVNVTGSATITNYYNNLTIWTGNNLDSIGNAGKTFVRNPTVSPPQPDADGVWPEPPDEPNACTTSASYVCTTDKNNVGPDVIANDTSLSSLSGDDYFRNFFGVAPSTYKSAFASLTIPGADFNTLKGDGGKTIWVEGTPPAIGAGGGTIGTRENPVVLIIDSAVVNNMNATVYGMVYVIGDVELGGNLTVFGTMVVQGQISGTGSLDIIYDPEVMKNAGRIAKPAPIPGSWRDWVALD